MIIETKYNIGDVVYHGCADSVQRAVKCVDCDGTGEVTVTPAAGKPWKVKCPPCYGKGTLLEYGYDPKVESMTIGSVRFNSNDAHNPVTYMCRETGVGSGSVWSEKSLHETHEIAARAAMIDVQAHLEAREARAKEHRANALRQSLRKKTP